MGGGGKEKEPIEEVVVLPLNLSGEISIEMHFSDRHFRQSRNLIEKD